MANSIFTNDFPPPSWALHLSLQPTLLRLYGWMGKANLTPGESHMRYWVARQNEPGAENNPGKVIGTTGLYTMKNDPTAQWLGWMSVDPDHRGQGIGRALLHHAIGTARSEGTEMLRLYTSDREGERAAQEMYQNHGLQEVRRVWDERSKCHFIYRELLLNKEE